MALTKEDKRWIEASIHEQIADETKAIREWGIEQIEAVQEARYGIWECMKCKQTTETAWYRVRWAPTCYNCGGSTKFAKSARVD